MKCIKLALCLLCVAVIASNNIQESYKSALNYDPMYRAALANAESSRKQTDITTDAFKPQIKSTASVHHKYYSANSNSDSFNDNHIGLDLQQTLYNAEQWGNYQLAKISNQQSTAQLQLAKQNLILDVSTKYINVLQHYSIYKATKSQVQQLAVQLKNDTARYKVGTITKTVLLETTAKYDAIVADVINSKNKLIDSIDEFEELTHLQQPKFAILSYNSLLDAEINDSITAQLQKLYVHNLDLMSKYYQTVGIKQKIAIAASGHAPKLDIIASAEKIHIPNEAVASYYPVKDATTSQVGLQLTMPIYQGGMINDQTKKAEIDYRAAAEYLEQTKSSLTIALKKTNHHLTAGVEQIKALKKAVESATSSFKSHKIAYEAGTQTNLELLSSISQLKDAQSNYAIARYQFLKEKLTHKKLLGSLSEQDILELDKLLAESIIIPK